MLDMVEVMFRVVGVFSGCVGGMAAVDLQLEQK